MTSTIHRNTGISDNLSPYPVSEPLGSCLLHYDKLSLADFSMIYFLLYFSLCSPLEEQTGQVSMLQQMVLGFSAAPLTHLNIYPLHRTPILFRDALHSPHPF